MANCATCNKVYRGGKDWKISKGFYSTYATCPKHSKDNPQEKAYEDLRIKREQLGVLKKEDENVY